MIYLQQVIMKPDFFKDFDYNSSDSMFINAIGYEGTVSLNASGYDGIGVVFSMVNTNNHVFHVTFPMLSGYKNGEIYEDFEKTCIDDKIVINSFNKMNYDAISILIRCKESIEKDKYKFYYIVRNTQTNKFAKIFISERQAVIIKMVLDSISKNGTTVSLKEFSELIKLSKFTERQHVQYASKPQIDIIKILYNKKSNMANVLFTIKNGSGKNYMDTENKYFIINIFLDKKYNRSIKKNPYFTSNIKEFFKDKNNNDIKYVYYCNTINMCELEYKYKPYGGGSGPANSKTIFIFDTGEYTELIEFEKYEFRKLSEDITNHVLSLY